MAPGSHPDLDRLTAVVDALGTAFADLTIETFTSETLKLASVQVSRAANMIDGIRADLARKERDLRPPAGTVAPPPSRSLDPQGQRSGRQQEHDSERSDLFDDLPALGDATRRGELSGNYADTVNHATSRLTAAERDAFYARYREVLTQRALTSDLHAFRVYVRGLVDDFGRARELERLQQQRRDRSGSIWIDHGTGMVKLFTKFDPETGARVRKAIDEEVDRLYRAKRDDPNDTRTHQQLVADAIANLILGARASSESRTELVVLVDLHTLITDDPHHATDAATHTAAPTTDTAPATGSSTTAASSTTAGDKNAAATTLADGSETCVTATAPEAMPADTDATTTDGAETADADSKAETTPVNPGAGRCCETSDGTPLPIETVRRLACDAGIIPAILNGHGVVVDLGRAQRLASKWQRRQLRTMYPTCAFNGCTTTFNRCEIHHIDPFGPPIHGDTNIDNLIPTCQHHHHQIHDGHLQLSLDPTTRTLTVEHPDGSQERHPFIDRRRQPSADPGDFPHVDQPAGRTRHAARTHRPLRQDSTRAAATTP